MSLSFRSTSKSTAQPFYYLSARLDIASLLPSTPNTDFEILAYFNQQNSLEYLDNDVTDYRQFHIVEPRQTITDVAIYSNPDLNKLFSSTNVNFDQIGIVATESPTTDPSSIVLEPYLNITQNPLLSVEFVSCAVIDPNELFVYYGGWGTITKFNASTFQVQDTYTLPYLGSFNISSSRMIGGVMDSKGIYAYFLIAISPLGGFVPAIVKIDLDSFSQVAVLPISTFTSFPLGVDTSAFAIDPFDECLYVGSYESPAKVAKIQLSDFTLQTTLTLNSGENQLRSAIISSQNYGYFCTINGIVVRVDLATMTRTGSLTLSLSTVVCAVIDRSNNLGYFAGYGVRATVSKVDLATSPNPTLISTSANPGFIISDSQFPTSAVITPDGQKMFVFSTYIAQTVFRLIQFDLTGLTPTPVAVINLPVLGFVDFSSFSISSNIYYCSVYASNAQQIFSAIYYSKTDASRELPTSVVQIGANPLQVVQTLDLQLSLISASYTTIDSQSSFMYVSSAPPFSSNVYTPVMIKLDLETYQQVGTVNFTNASDRTVWSIQVDSSGEFAYCAVERIFGNNEAIYKVQTSTMTVASVLTLSVNTTIRATLLDRTSSYLYVFCAFFPPRILKVDVNTMTEVGSCTLGSFAFASVTTPFIDTDNRYLYCGTNTASSLNGNGVVFKVDLSTFTYLGFTSLWTGAPTQQFVGSDIAVYDPTTQMGYFVGTNSRTISKLDLSTPLPTLISQFQPASPSDNYCSGLSIDPAGKYAYMYMQKTFGVQSSFSIEIVDLELFQTSTVLKNIPLRISWAFLYVMDPRGRFQYWVTSTAPPQIVRMNLTNSLLSGLSTNAPSNLQNTTDIVDIDYKAQVAKLRSTSQIQNLVQPRYLGLYLKGSTGDVVDPDASFTFHTRLKVYPN